LAALYQCTVAVSYCPFPMFRHSSFKPLEDVETRGISQRNPLQGGPACELSTVCQRTKAGSLHGGVLKLDMDSSTSSDRSGSIQVDLEHLHQSLDDANQLSKRRATDKLPPVLMYEITSNGQSCYKNITLRELLNDIIDESAAIDGEVLTRASDLHNTVQTESKMAPADGVRDRRVSTGGDRITPSISGGDLATMGAAPVAHRAAPASKPPVGSAADGHGRRRGLSAAPGYAGLAGTRSVYDMRYSPSVDPNVGLAYAHGSNSPVPVPAQTYDATGTLRLRDLRRLDFSFNPNEERSVLIRRHAVLFAMVSSVSAREYTILLIVVV
jgi:hypothetical protein